MWCKVTRDNSSFVAGPFYRSPNSSVTALKFLPEIVLEASCHTFILAGDFNLPDLSWRDGTCEKTAGGILNLEMKHIVDSCGLIQHATTPTRCNNTLDLVFCNSPNMVNSVNFVPGRNK